MLCLSTPHADCILPVRATEAPTSTLPQHAPRRMHLDVAPVSANASALPQHVLRGLHRFVRLEHVVQFALPQHVLRGLHRGDRAVVSAIGIFASARPTRIASCDKVSLCIFSTLCLSTSYADCISPADGAGDIQQPFASARPTRIASRGVLLFRASGVSLPQHVLRGLHHGAQIGSSGSYAFASARPTRIASDLKVAKWTIPDFASARPTRIASPGSPFSPFAPFFASARPTRIASYQAEDALLHALFASARPTRIASSAQDRPWGYLLTLPQHVLRGLHPRTAGSRNPDEPLPQHVLRGLHQALITQFIRVRFLCLSTSYADCIGKNAQGKAGVYDGRCCESVDSFSIIEER